MSFNSTSFMLRTTSGRLPDGLKEALDFGRIWRGGGVAAGFEDARDDRLIALLKFEHALFGSALGDELVDEDRLVLADAVGTVGCPVLDGRVPSRIVMDNGVGGGQIETGAAGLEADQEERHLAPLKARDRGPSCRRAIRQT